MTCVTTSPHTRATVMVVLVVDETGDLKKGSATVGVWSFIRQAASIATCNLWQDWLHVPRVRI
jgi:hypothetical protein